MYGDILDKYENESYNPTGLLLRCLANVVYHYPTLKNIIINNTDHVFNKVPLLQDHGLYKELSPLVTVKTSVNMMDSTGIPSHVKISQLSKETFDKCVEILELSTNQTG